MAAEQGVLQFKSFQSTLDSGFWNELSKRKLEKYQLSDAPVSIHGSYTNSSPIGLPTTMSLEYSAFLDTQTLSIPHYPINGMLTVKGTQQIDHSLYIEGVSVPDR